MTNTEFSDSFDVLLNSYNTKAEFGDQASKREIVLDEYEKSVLLTQAQDIIVKSYFDRNLNSEGKGFDDGTKRQVDFSSLIKVEDLYPVAHPNNTVILSLYENDEASGYWGDFVVTNIFDKLVELRIMVSFDLDSYTTEAVTEARINNYYLSIFINTKLFSAVNYRTMTINQIVEKVLNTEIIDDDKNRKVGDIIRIAYVPHQKTTPFRTDIEYIICNQKWIPSAAGLGQTFDERGVIYLLPSKLVGNEHVSNVLFVLNEKLIVDGKNYVIVPINYQEYDREMSKPYRQPLKRQAWRLFQNVSTGIDVYSELIPKWNIDISNATYRIRYVRRPRPIVLEDFENLDIDGVSTETSCELNPILHNEILQKAFEIAVQTRGGGSAAQPERQERRG